MITLVSDNIISSLGFTTEENYLNMKQGITGLACYEGLFDLPEPFVVSMIDDTKLDEAYDRLPNIETGNFACADLQSVHQSKHTDYKSARAMQALHAVSACADLQSVHQSKRTDYKSARATNPETPNPKPETRNSKLEKAAILSVSEALKHTEIDPSNPNVLFILSTTKGNVFLLDPIENGYDASNQLFLWHSAKSIAQYFDNDTPPITISNACISGAYAMLTAQRALLSGKYKYVIVTGVDMLSRFIISGFQSFKALSPSLCKPFDENRDGLNIGEAAATIILTNKNEADLLPGDVVLSAGAIRNDANHISGPSRTGEGATLALKNICNSLNINELAFINAHGTATPYNDEMEAVAITRAGLQHTPVTCQKGYFGHTLGAAGVIESIISTRSLKDRTVLKTYGFKTSGVSHQLRIVEQTQPINGHHCINMLSGFGGCNAALLYTRIS